MQKVWLYSGMITLFMWLGGILPAVQAAPEAAAEGEVGLLDPQWGPLIWQIILFVILIAVLGFLVWPQVLKGLQQREDKIRTDLEGAERANRDAAATLEQYKKQLADAQREAQQVIEQSRTDAQRVATQLKDQAQSDIQQMRQRAENDIRAAKEQAIADIYDQTATLATRVAGQILRRELTPEDHQALVRESLEELAATRA